MPARAGGLAAAQGALRVLDQVSRRPSRQQTILVEMLAAARQVGDDETRVRAQLGRLDAGDEGLEYLDDGPSDLRCDGESRTRVAGALRSRQKRPHNLRISATPLHLTGRTSVCPLQRPRTPFGNLTSVPFGTCTLSADHYFFRRHRLPCDGRPCSPSSAGASVAIGGVSSATSRRPFFSECHLHRRERPTIFSVVWTARGLRIVNGAGLAAGPHWGA